MPSMMLQTFDLSPALNKVFLPNKEESQQVFFPKMVSEDLPTHFNKSNYVLT